MDAPQVTVVIPAYNAAATIDRTLASVRGQTLREIEILAIDDGSRDDTAGIVARHGAADPRVRLIGQANSGVAIARNHGIGAARAPLIAVIDADDLWTADALERLAQALAKAGAAAGLAYGGYALIDASDRILRIASPAAAGRVQRDLAVRNIVGSGSGVLFRRAAWEHAGGYDPALHQAGAQGCEDHLFYFRVAERWTFATVDAALLGYRMAAGAMSSQYDRMLRSHELCAARILAAHPEYAAQVAAGAADYRRWLLRRAIEFGPAGAVPRLWREASRHGARAAARSALAGLRRRFAVPGARFSAADTG